MPTETPAPEGTYTLQGLTCLIGQASLAPALQATPVNARKLLGYRKRVYGEPKKRPRPKRHEGVVKISNYPIAPLNRFAVAQSPTQMGP